MVLIKSLMTKLVYIINIINSQLNNPAKPARIYQELMKITYDNDFKGLDLFATATMKA